MLHTKTKCQILLVHVYNSDGIVDGYEDDAEEIRDMVIAQVEGLSEHWDEDEEEFTEEGDEMYHENIWEEISNAQMTLVNDTLKYLEDLEKEAVAG